MKFARRFLAVFAPLIHCILSCFDRVIIKGRLSIHSDEQLNSFVRCFLKIRHVDFMDSLSARSEQLVDHAKDIATEAGRPYIFLDKKVRKEEMIQQMVESASLTVGLVAVLCAMETCKTVKLVGGKGAPRLTFVKRPQRVLYFYYLDPNFGLMHIRLETYFTYAIQVYVNGHNWLARQMLKRKLGFTQLDNTFSHLENPEESQRLADQFAQINWVKELGRMARRVNPFICAGGWLSTQNYYWVTEQAEYASDVIFKDRSQLKDLCPRLMDYALVNFNARDILTFLGRKLTGHFLGDVSTDLKKEKRLHGARVKHRMKQNWIKMYDKFGLVLRVETVINDPREFKVRRTRTRKGKKVKVWVGMNKGVTNLASYQKHCRAANDRYLNALSFVKDPTPSYQRVADVVDSKTKDGRSYAGFNPGKTEDVRLFEAVLSGEHELRGFYNIDVRKLLFPETNDANKNRSQANAMTRKLKRLHVRGLIAKIPRTRRWRVTDKGRVLLGAIVRLHRIGLSTCA